MATLNQETVASAGGAGAGLGGTVLLRERFDRSGDDAITRPSVLYGLGTGLTMLSVTALAHSGKLDVPAAALPAVEAWGTAATVAGVFSALYPKGSTSALIPSTQFSG